MIKNRYILIALLSLFVGWGFSSCQDEHDEHYDRSGDLPNENLYELIKLNDDLSKFTKLVEIAGYDTLLKSTQTFTLWAPVNDALSGIDLSTVTKEQAQLIVNNHLARFNNSTSSAAGKLVRMRNYKIYTFSDGGMTFGGAQLISHDILARNGLLHTLKSQITHHYNLYEYIKATSTTSKFWAFVKSFEEEKFDEEASIPIDIDESGRTIYDTVTTFYNRLFDDLVFGLGKINIEDSIYTMLTPSDQAWDAAYARMSPYFKRSTKDKNGDSIQSVQTSLAILNNLIFRGMIENPSSRDSLISTGGHVVISYGAVIKNYSTFHDPADLFLGAVKETGSNGLIFNTDDLRYNNKETWNPTIYVEGDETIGRTAGTNSAIYTRSVTNNDTWQITDGRYIEVQPTSPTANPAVTFSIPNTLSGKYNVYVEFIPGSIDGNPKDSTKLLFDLQYMTATGSITSKTANTNDLVTSGTKKVRMKVFSEFELPVSDLYDNLWWIDFIDGKHTLEEFLPTTKLMVKTNVTATDFNKNIYTRRFRIDRIIFESVRN